ncbi:MAG: hypothetical protein ACLT1C_07435 [Weissella confusa]
MWIIDRQTTDRGILGKQKLRLKAPNDAKTMIMVGKEGRQTNNGNLKIHPSHNLNQKKWVAVWSRGQLKKKKEE